MLWISTSLFSLSILLNIVVWCSNPGFIEKDNSLVFVNLLDSLEASSLCPDCEVIRTPRCRHCTLCKRCVDRFDHHCPWVNNCIGKGNFIYFYSFVTTQTIYLLSLVIITFKCKSIIIFVFEPSDLSHFFFRFRIGIWTRCDEWSRWSGE